MWEIYRIEIMAKVRTEYYQQEAAGAIKDEVLQNALADVQGRLGKGTAAAYQNLPEGPELRFRAHDIRLLALATSHSHKIISAT